MDDHLKPHHGQELAQMPGRRSKTTAVRVRRARLQDIPAIYACQRAAYATFPPMGLCDERQLQLQLEAFPEGQFVALRRQQIVGYATALIVQLDDDSPWYSYSEITGNGTFSTHDPSGDTLYGADIVVHPEHRGQGIAGCSTKDGTSSCGALICAAWWRADAYPATVVMRAD